MSRHTTRSTSNIQVLITYTILNPFQCRARETIDALERLARLTTFTEKDHLKLSKFPAMKVHDMCYTAIKTVSNTFFLISVSVVVHQLISFDEYTDDRFQFQY